MTEKIEKLFAMTETDIDCFKSWIRALGYGSISDARKAEQTMLGILQSLPLITGEPIAMMQAATGGANTFIGWGEVLSQPAGTKFYTHAKPLPNETLDDLLGQYWDTAHKEGKTGESFGDEANEVLYKIRQLVKPLQPITAEDVTDEMVAIYCHSGLSSRSDHSDMIAAAYNAVITGQTK